ncbi:MAG TPA: FUSC family protein, partial [Gemmatimonadales bacterium]|nr:FUSC family protein [Gemmatimonadales bacterium]
AAQEVARAALATVRRGRPGESGRGERLLVLGETADQVYGNLFGLTDVMESLHGEANGGGAQRALAEVTRDVGETLRTIATAIEEEDRSPAVTVGWSGDTLRRSLEAAGEELDADTLAHYRHAAQILDRTAQYAGVAAAVAAGLNAGSQPPPLERKGEIEDTEPPLPWLAPLRAALSPDSLVSRYALRLAIVTAAAVALTSALGLKRGYWVTITAVIILQPFVGATSLRALQRVLGTVVGGALAALLAAWFHSPTAVLVMVFVFSAVSVALLPLNYAVFSVFLTPTFVLLAEASAGDWHLAGLRIVNTLLGGGLAVAGTWLLWPSPEAERLPEHLAEVLETMRGYLAEVIARFADRSDAAGDAIRAARRRVGLAILNAEQSLERLLGEQRGRADDVTPAMTLVTYARRFTASVAALALSRHSVAAVPAEALAPFASGMDQALADLAAAITEGRRPQPLEPVGEPPDPTLPPLLRGRLTRLRRQLKTLHDAVERQVAASRLANQRGKL